MSRCSRVLCVGLAALVAAATARDQCVEPRSRRKGPFAGIRRWYRNVRLNKCREELIRVDPAMVVEASDGWYPAFSLVGAMDYDRPESQAPFVVVPRTLDQLRQALAAANRHNVKVSARSGGHNYTGFSQAPPGGFQINLYWLNNKTFEETGPGSPGRPVMRVQTATHFEDIYQTLQDHHSDWIMAGGFCPSVNVGGFFLGGGIGAVERQYGIGVDSVLEATVLKADGSEYVVANATQNQDLLWAIRGGGSIFGIVAEFVVQLHPALPKYSYGEYCTGDRRDDMAASLQRLANVTAGGDFPDWLSVHWSLRKRNSTNTGVCYLIYSLRGREETKAVLLASGFIPAPELALFKDARHPVHGLEDRQNIHRTIAKHERGDHPHWNFLEQYDDLWDMEQKNAIYKGYAPIDSYSQVSKCCMAPGLDAPGLIDFLLDVREKMPGFGCYTQGMAFGGQIAAKAEDYTAFPWRERIVYASESNCNYVDAEEKAEATAWVDYYVAGLDALGANLGTYMNFPHRDLPDYPKAYWRNNVAKLQEVRARWNPDKNSPLSYPQEVPLP